MKPIQPSPAEIRQALLNTNQPPVNRSHKIYRAIQHVKESQRWNYYDKNK